MSSKAKLPPLALTSEGASPEARHVKTHVKTHGLLSPAPFPFHRQPSSSSANRPRGLLGNKGLQIPGHLQRRYCGRVFPGNGKTLPKPLSCCHKESRHWTQNTHNHRVLQHMPKLVMSHGSHRRPQYRIGLKSYLRAFRTEVP